LDEIVVDKHLGERCKEKRNRCHRHYGKQFIKNSLTSGDLPASSDVDENTIDEAQQD
jgi:hypothetical protein